MDRNNTYYLKASVGLVERAYVMEYVEMLRRNLLYIMHCAHGMIAKHYEVVDPDGDVISIEIVMEVR